MGKVVVIIDSSVIIKWLNTHNEKFLEQADIIIKDSNNNRITILAPELAKYEVGNVLLFSKKLTVSESEIILEELHNLPITFIPEVVKLSKATYTLAYELSLTYYDASFLALAKQYNAVLVTDNIKHHGRAKDVKVISLQDYSLENIH